MKRNWLEFRAETLRLGPPNEAQQHCDPEAHQDDVCACFRACVSLCLCVWQCIVCALKQEVHRCKRRRGVAVPEGVTDAHAAAESAILALAALQADFAPRFDACAAAQVVEYATAGAELDAWQRTVTGGVRSLVRHTAKILDVHAEAAAVLSDQLQLYAAVIDVGITLGEPAGVATGPVAVALGGASPTCAPTLFPTISIPVPTGLLVAQSHGRVCGGVDWAACEVAGPGSEWFVCGIDNSLLLTVRDAAGAPIASIQDHDVCVRVDVPEGTVWASGAVRPGVLAYAYTLPLGWESPVPLCVSVLGRPLPLSPFIVLVRARSV